MPPLCRPVLVGLLLTLGLQTHAQPGRSDAAVPGRELAPARDAIERIQDADTALQLSSDGELLYEQQEVKLDGYQYCSQAVAYAERGDFRRSVRAASMALHLGQQAGNEDLVGKSNRDLAIAYSYSGNLDKAEQFARDALEHEARDPTQVVGPAHKVIGDVQTRRGDYATAVQSYETALAASSPRYRPLVQASLANALILSGEYDQARAQLDALPVFDQASLNAQVQRTRASLLLAEGKPEQARAIYQALAEQSAGSDAAYQRLWALDGLARSELAMGNQPAAADALAQTIDSLDQVRARFRSEEFKMGLFSDVQDIFERAIALNSELGRAPQAFAYSERSRARALLDAVRDRGKLSAQATATMDLAALQQVLRSDERVVEFHDLDKRLLVWVIGPESIREVGFDLSRNDLQAMVEAFRNAIVEGRENAIDGGDSIGRLLIEPLELPAGARLVIVPHGPLHYLPFQALRVQGRYLIENHPLSTAPSITIAAQLAGRNAQVAPELVAFGNPEVAPDYALPGSEVEVRELAELFPDSKTYLNAAATKTRFTQTAGTARLLHVAAHAQADRVDPLYSRILLANENGKQNFLEAHEVLGLQLDDVALVTLSACESGLGRVADGDEVLGFSRAFLSAGTSARIVSLWPVADDATELLMTTLYGELAKGVDVQQAMQAAQLVVLQRQDMSHPFFWAPFDVIGNWRLTVRK